MAPSSESSPDDEVVVQAFESTHGAEDGEGHGKVETGAFLAELGRGEVDGDGLVGVAEAGVHEGGLDSFAAFADGVVGGADEHEIAGHATAEEVYFNIDEVGVDTVHRSTFSFEERHEPWIPWRDRME